MGAVGFIGLGNIGKPMARRLLDWPGGLLVHDISPEPVAELEGAGAKVAAGPADIARHAEVVCVMVRDDDQVRAVLDEILTGAPAGLVVAVHSTVAPDTPAELAQRAAGHGVRVVDAPVSGGAMGAADGTLAILVGGEDGAVATAEPVLRRLGSMVVHAGPVGAGTRMKLARNLLHFVAFTAATEAQRLAEAAGLDLVALGSVVRHTDKVTGGPGAIMHRPTTETLAPDDFWTGAFGHVRALGEKDLDFALELADRLGVDLPLARLARTRLGPGLGLPDADQATGPAGTLRERGLRKMTEVYGWEMKDGPGDFFRYTADHLFADIWSRPGLSRRDRRLLLIGLLAGSGQADVLGIQLPAAYARGELDDDAMREIVIFLSHYAGWPMGARLNTLVEETIGKARAARRSRGS
ncbi:MAG TPA: NAD(P)-dependent oxidoreductase [Rugosimonospora sp.]|nr:NAD(P)-dependent oxidoreductase [Rugosimonospora sp.]